MLSLPTTTKSKTHGELLVDLAHGLSSGSSARPLADLPSLSGKNIAKTVTIGMTASDANALAPGELTIDPVHGLTPGESTQEQKLAKTDSKAAVDPEGDTPSPRI